MVREAGLVVALLVAPGCSKDPGAAPGQTGRAGKASPADAFRHVDEVMKAPAELVGRKGVKAHGFVAPGSIRQEMVDGEVVRQFRLEHGGAGVEVRYRGVVPDAFRDNAEVVVTGTLAKDGDTLRIEASELMAKCPSGYTPPA
jgi:cytochrome c-type biogenesis protein CcmE